MWGRHTLSSHIVGWSKRKPLMLAGVVRHIASQSSPWWRFMRRASSLWEKGAVREYSIHMLKHTPACQTDPYCSPTCRDETSAHFEFPNWETYKVAEGVPVRDALRLVEIDRPCSPNTVSLTRQHSVRKTHSTRINASPQTYIALTVRRLVDPAAMELVWHVHANLVPFRV